MVLLCLSEERVLGVVEIESRNVVVHESKLVTVAGIVVDWCPSSVGEIVVGNENIRVVEVDDGIYDDVIGFVEVSGHVSEVQCSSITRRRIADSNVVNLAPGLYWQ